MNGISHPTGVSEICYTVSRVLEAFPLEPVFIREAGQDREAVLTAAWEGPRRSALETNSGCFRTCPQERTGFLNRGGDIPAKCFLKIDVIEHCLQVGNGPRFHGTDLHRHDTLLHSTAPQRERTPAKDYYRNKPCLSWKIVRVRVTIQSRRRESFSGVAAEPSEIDGHRGT